VFLYLDRSHVVAAGGPARSLFDVGLLVLRARMDAAPKASGRPGKLGTLHDTALGPDAAPPFRPLLVAHVMLFIARCDAGCSCCAPSLYRVMLSDTQ
jgi:hypothetical protein